MAEQEPKDPTTRSSDGDYSTDESFREMFGMSRRQAENLSDYFERRHESRQYEKLGRALVKKVVYLIGTIVGAVWLLVTGSDKLPKILEAILK